MYKIYSYYLVMKAGDLIPIKSEVKHAVNLLNHYYGKEAVNYPYEEYFLVHEEDKIETDGITFFNGSDRNVAFGYSIALCMNDRDKDIMREDYRYIREVSKDVLTV